MFTAVDSCPESISLRQHTGQERPLGSLLSPSFLSWKSRVTALGAPSRGYSGLGVCVGGICFSPFLGALGSSCKKRMRAICWCSELARHPGRTVLCQGLVKTLARTTFPMPGVSSGRLGTQPSARPEAEQGQGGLLVRTRRAVCTLPLAQERGNSVAVRVP